MTGDHAQIVGVEADDAKISICFGETALEGMLKLGNAPTTPSIVILRRQIADLHQDRDG